MFWIDGITRRTRTRQIHDPVEGHAKPGRGGDEEGIEKTKRRVLNDLIPLAGVTIAHVSIDCCSQSRPFEILGHDCLRPRHAVVSRERGIVILLQNLEDEGGCRGGNENAVLMVEDACV